MKALRNIAQQPAAVPITADDILEFHAARLLLLFRICGTKNRMDGLTKMAKLDFFVRYPQFFERLFAHVQKHSKAAGRTVESSMVRHHYGPWDKRYYHVLAYLEGAELIGIRREGSTFVIELTAHGQDLADSLKNKNAFAGLVTQMKAVKKALGSKSGSVLKKMIYAVFEEEVADRVLGEVID
jgi:hypothetical protein